MENENNKGEQIPAPIPRSVSKETEDMWHPQDYSGKNSPEINASTEIPGDVLRWIEKESLLQEHPAPDDYGYPILKLGGATTAPLYFQ
jgi:hypothetical protein